MDASGTQPKSACFDEIKIKNAAENTVFFRVSGVQSQITGPDAAGRFAFADGVPGRLARPQPLQ